MLHLLAHSFYRTTAGEDKAMPRKESITKQMIFDAAFSLLKEEGKEEVTARKLAAKIGCSTQPIFRVYGGMEELLSDLYLRGVTYFNEFYHNAGHISDTPFTDLGMAYIAFAAREKHLFRWLFLPTEKMEKEMYDILNGGENVVTTQLKRAAESGCKDPGTLFMKMWVFIHGIACMTLTGDYDLSARETVDMLTQSYHAFLK